MPTRTSATTPPSPPRWRPDGWWRTPRRSRRGPISPCPCCRLARGSRHWWHDAAMASTPMPTGRGGTAFVLGGGGVLGAAEVGMLRRLYERRSARTSSWAPRWARSTARSSPPTRRRARSTGCASCGRSWPPAASSPAPCSAGWAPWCGAAPTCTRANRCASCSMTHLPVTTFAELAVPFQCVAASIERAAEHLVQRRALIEAVLASCAVPGLLPPVEIDGEHYLDGGLVHSIPVGRAVAAGRRHDLRAARRADRAPLRRRPAVGGRAGRVRDRPPAPVRRGPGRAARRASRVHVLPAGDEAGRAGTCGTCATATGPGCARPDRPGACRRPRATWPAPARYRGRRA